jgi:hypothetical protein
LWSLLGLNTDALGLYPGKAKLKVHLGLILTKGL